MYKQFMLTRIFCFAVCFFFKSMIRLRKTQFVIFLYTWYSLIARALVDQLLLAAYLIFKNIMKKKGKKESHASPHSIPLLPIDLLVLLNWQVLKQQLTNYIDYSRITSYVLSQPRSVKPAIYFARLPWTPLTKII